MHWQEEPCYAKRVYPEERRESQIVVMCVCASRGEERDTGSQARAGRRENVGIVVQKSRDSVHINKCNKLHSDEERKINASCHTKKKRQKTDEDRIAKVRQQ